MKKLILVFIGIAVALLIYNLTKVDWSAPFMGDSTVALISIFACGCAIMLLLILRVSLKISEKHKS